MLDCFIQKVSIACYRNIVARVFINQPEVASHVVLNVVNYSFIYLFLEFKELRKRELHKKMTK